MMKEFLKTEARKNPVFLILVFLVYGGSFWSRHNHIILYKILIVVSLIENEWFPQKPFNRTLLSQETGLEYGFLWRDGIL